PGAPAPSTRPAPRPRNARADGPVQGVRKDEAAWGETSRGGGTSAYRDNAGESSLAQPHATPEVLEPRVSSEGGVLRFAADRGRQIDIVLLECSPQPGYGLLTLVELDVLASEGGRWNVSVLRSRPQQLKGSGGPEQARRGVAGAAPATPHETRVCGVAPLPCARSQLLNGRIVGSLPGECLRKLIVGRRINRVERQLLFELRGRVRRTTGAREDPAQLVREMAGQRVQLDGPAHLRLGFVEASERPEIHAEQVVRLGVGRIERDRAVIQRLGGGPAPMVARRRLGDERLGE